MYAQEQHEVLNRRWQIALTCLVIFFLLMKPAFASLSTDPGAPAGFELLEAPRPTVITVYYGGELLGNFAAHFTPAAVQFDQADLLLAAVPDIADKTVVGLSLRKPLPANFDLLCTDHRTENCGTLTPEIIGVIFDENHLSAELFINRQYLAIVKDDAKKFLPLPDRHLSSVYNVNGAVSGMNSQTPTYSAGYSSTYSYGEARLDSQSTVTNQGVRFDTAAASVDRNGWSGSTGLFRSRSMQLIGDHDIAGVSLSTSRRTLVDEHKTEGNDVILYLPRRSFVSIYREGRLYSSHSYEAGNQSIDTSELPDGAYTITLKIQEIDGETREETRFFSKSEQLPPPGSPTYYAEAGFIRQPASMDETLPQVTGYPLLRAGTVQRISDNLGLSASFLGVADRGAVEPGIFWIYQNSQLTTTLLGSTRGDAGVQTSYQYVNQKFSASTDFREVWMSDKPIPGDDGELVRRLTQTTVTVSYALFADFTVGVRGSYSKQSDMATTSSLGPHAQWNIWQEGESSLSLTADAARTANQNQASVFLHFSHRLGNYGITGSTGASLGQGKAGPSGNVSLWHDDETPGRSLLLAGGVAADRQDKTVDGDFRWHNNFGQMEGGVQKTFGPIGSPLTYGGNFGFNAAALADEIHIGGNQNEKAAVIIKTTGDADEEMRVMVNGAPQSVLHVGHEQVIYLTPFHKYNIRITSEKKSLLDYDSGNRVVTLYPGNVSKLEWTVNKFYVVVAHIVKPDGTPLQNALLKETRAQVATDAKGHFQAEVAKANMLTFVDANNGTCEVRLPMSVQPVKGVLLYRDALRCLPVTETASR